MKKRLIGLDEICAFILAFVLSYTAMSIYGGGVVRLFLICFAFSLICFVVCHLVNEHRFIGTFGIIAFFAVYFAVMIRLITVGESRSGAYFWQWMVSGGDIQTLEIEAGSDLLILIGMFMAVNLFFMVTVFYFSVPTYRFGYLTLVSLMPFVLYAKVTAEVENKYLVIVVLASIALHLVCSRKVTPTRQEYKEAKKAGKLLKHVDPIHHRDWDIKIKGGFAFYLGFAVLALIILAVSAVVPKRSEARFYDKFEDIFLGGDTESAIDENFSGIAEMSGNADNFREGSNRRLYIVTGDGTPHLKRQVFDVYDFEIDRWYPESSEQTVLSTSEWITDKKIMSLTGLANALLKAEESEKGFLDRFGMGGLIEAGPISDPARRYTITAQNFGAGYYLSSARICGISLPDTEKANVTEKGTFFREEGVHDKNISYSIECYNTTSGIEALQKSGCLDIGPEDSLDMLREAEEILVNRAREVSASDDLTDRDNLELLGYINIISAFKDDLIKAITYRDRMSAAQGEVPVEVTQLAERLTEGYKYDWEKAVVLNSYFRNNDFLYDIKYRAPDDSPSYFLFEGKTGTCSDFASAFVLLAREAGLIVRYTEGFIPDNTYGEMYQIITESDSHAYAEVYLENVGWTVFDPTSGVPNANSGGFFDFFKSLKVDTGLLTMLGYAAIAIAFVVLVIKLLIPLMIELIFRLRLVFADPEKTLIPAYKRLLKKAGKSLHFEPTPGEFADIIKERGTDISEFVLLIEKVEYANRKMSVDKSEIKKEKKIIFKGYLTASKALRQ